MTKLKLTFLIAACCVCVSLCFSACSLVDSSQNSRNHSDNLQESFNTSVSVETQTPYTIRTEGGSSNLYFDEKFTTAIAEEPALSTMPYLDLPKFSSVAEMKQRIETGNIPEKQLSSLYIANGKRDVLKTVDLSELYDAQLPEEFSVDYIIWRGESYEFCFSTDQYHGQICFLSEETYNDYLKDNYFNQQGTNVDEMKKRINRLTILSDTRIEDRDARVIHYTTESAELKRIEYQINSNGRSVTVCEEYTLDYFSEDAPWRTSDTVPDAIYMYSTDGGVNFQCYIWEPTDRPSVEWLSSFGLTPLAE